MPNFKRYSHRSIGRYNDIVKNAFKLKHDVQPWLHSFIAWQPGHVIVAVYIWDTREVVEEAKANMEFDEFHNIVHDQGDVRDNRQPLVGYKNGDFAMELRSTLKKVPDRPTPEERAKRREAEFAEYKQRKLREQEERKARRERDRNRPPIPYKKHVRVRRAGDRW